MKRFEIAKANAKNRTKIKQAITQVNRSLNQAIKENKQDLEYANIRLLMIMFAAYLESTLGFLLYFHGAQIKTKSVNYILAKRTEVERWDEFIDFCFRRNFINGAYSCECEHRFRVIVKT